MRSVWQGDLGYTEFLSLQSFSNPAPMGPSQSFADVTSSHLPTTCEVAIITCFVIWTQRLGVIKLLAQGHKSCKKEDWYDKPKLKSMCFLGHNSDNFSNIWDIQCECGHAKKITN